MASGPDHELARRAVETVSLARRLFPRGDAAGLEPNTRQVLLALYVAPGETVIGLSKTLGLAKTTVSHAVSELQSRKLTETVPGDADARRRPQRLTAAGEAQSRRLIGELRERW
jgi:DNA-binding MarR family transcriptional regulator